MSLLELCNWIQFSPPLVAMRSSWWLFPAIATMHLMGLAVIGGAVLLVDLRLLNLGLRRQGVAELVRGTNRWLAGGVLVMIATGIPLFSCFATKYYYLAFFWVKMAALVGVIAFTGVIRHRLGSHDANALSPGRSKLVAAVSLSLWTTVALGGRWIGFP